MAIKLSRWYMLSEEHFQNKPWHWYFSQPFNGREIVTQQRVTTREITVRGTAIQED